MGSGERRHRVALEEPTVAIVSGESSTTWTNRGDRWASVEPLAGRELWRARQVQADVTHRIRLPWESTLSLTTQWRVRWGTRIFQLLAVLRPAERRVEWELLAKEAV